MNRQSPFALIDRAPGVSAEHIRQRTEAFYTDPEGA
jgi:hypothetical protein